MSSTESSHVFDGLIELLAKSADPQQVLDFRLPESDQQKLDSLLEKNRENDLTESDLAELESFKQLEHVVRLLKARMHGRLNQ